MRRWYRRWRFYRELGYGPYWSLVLAGESFDKAGR